MRATLNDMFQTLLHIADGHLIDAPVADEGIDIGLQPAPILLGGARFPFGGSQIKPCVRHTVETGNLRSSGFCHAFFFAKLHQINIFVLGLRLSPLGLDTGFLQPKARKDAEADNVLLALSLRRNGVITQIPRLFSLWRNLQKQRIAHRNALRLSVGLGILQIGMRDFWHSQTLASMCIKFPDRKSCTQFYTQNLRIVQAFAGSG